MKTGALYIRVSTEDQLEFSPDAQKRALLEYAKKNGIVISDKYIFIDEGISGRKAEKRPAFMRMIAAAKLKSHPFDVILVHKFDRFSRSREDSIVYKSLLRKECNVQVISITEHIEDDKFSVILEAMLEAMAEYYSLNLSDEVKKGMTEKASRGEYQTDAPLGYKMINKELVVDEEAAPIIKTIFNEYLNGTGIIQIARKLNAAGYKTKRNNKFENRSVRYILQNPVYCGYTRWNVGKNNLRAHIAGSPDMIVSKGSHEPIISEDIYNNVIDKFKANLPTRKMRSVEYANLYYSGLVVCSSCGAVLVRSKDGLQCHKYSHALCDESHYISISRLNNLIPDALLSILTKDTLDFTYHTFEDDLPDMLMQIKKSISTVNVKLKRCKDAYIAGIDTINEYKENKASLEKELRELENQLKVDDTVHDIKKDQLLMRNRIKKTIDILTSDKINVEDKAKALRFICDKIVYHKKPEKLDIYLRF